jgi:hypothetical protein
MLAGQKKGGNVFRCKKLEELMAGEDSNQQRLEKLISDENYGVQKVWSWNNHRILQNSKQISQPGTLAPSAC